MEIILTPKQYEYLNNKDISTESKLEELTAYINKCRTTKQYPDENRWFQILSMVKKIKQRGNYDGFDYGF